MFYVHYLVASQANGQTVGDGVRDTIEKIFNYLMYVLQPDGGIPAIGDSHSGHVSALDPHLVDDQKIEGILSIGAILFKRGDFKYVSKKVSEEAFFLFGKQGYDVYSRLAANHPNESSKGFIESGQFVMRTGWNKEDYYLLFDCGPQGWGEAGHGHADCLSFTLYALGRPLIIDPGTYRYNGAYDWRCFFRGTSAHNTIVVDGLDQAEALPPPDPFGWTRKVTGRLHAWHTSELFDYVDGEHDGYERLKEPVVHRRRILFVRNEYWVIFDLLSGQGEHSFNCLFHFAPCRVMLGQQSKNLTTRYGEGANLKVVPAIPQELHATVIEGSESPIQRLGVTYLWPETRGTRSL